MITSLISPSGDVSAQDDLWHIASSDNSGQTDFKFVFDVFKGANQLVRVKLYPDVDTGKGYFNAASVVKNEFSFDWFRPLTNTVNCNQFDNSDGNVGLVYQIRVGEDLTGTTTLNMASGNVQVYNWTPPLFKRRQNDISALLYKWFTNRPKKTKAELTDNIYIPYYSGVGDIYFDYEIYDINNNQINSDYGIAAANGSAFVQLNIGATAINGILGSDEITNAAAYYKIRFKNDDESEYTEWFTVYLDCNPLYETINLHFINQYGMFDTARFSKSSKLTMNIERKNYQRKEYDFKPSVVEYYDNNNVYKESKINYASKLNWVYQLTMDFPTDEEYQWLAELISSPQIYAEIDGDFYPVTLTANNYEYSKNINNGLRIFQVEIELNQTRNGFRR